MIIQTQRLWTDSP